MLCNTHHYKGRWGVLAAVVLAMVGAMVLVPKLAEASDEAVAPGIEIVNTVIGEDKACEYTVQTNGEPVTGEGYVTPEKSEGAEEGTYIFSLGNGQKAGFQVIDKSLTYKVTQAPSGDGWTTRVVNGDRTTHSKGSDSSMTDGTVEVGATKHAIAFTNVKIQIDGAIDPKLIQLPVTDDQKVVDTIYVKGMIPGQTYEADGALLAPDKTSVATQTVKSVKLPDDADVTTPQKIEIEYTVPKADVEKYVGQKLVATTVVKDVSSPDAPVVLVTQDDMESASHSVEVKDATAVLVITKTVSTPKTDEAIAEAQKAVDEATDDSARELAEVSLKAIQDLKKTEATDKEFLFDVKLTDADDKELANDVKYTVGDKEGALTKGVGTIALKDGESAKLADLPIGTKYEVREQKADGWKTTVEQNEGTMSATGDTTINFTNTALGSFSISKEIKNAEDGELSDELKATDFNFTVHVYKSQAGYRSGDLTEVEGEFSYVGSKEGSLKSGESIQLKGGESVSFNDLEPGIYVVVSESPTDGWKSNHTNLGGEIRELKVRTAGYVNTYGTSSGGGAGGGGGGGSYGGGTGGSSYGSTKSNNTTSTSSNSKLAKTADPATDALALGMLALALVGAGRVARKNR